MYTKLLTIQRFGVLSLEEKRIIRENYDYFSDFYKPEEQITSIGVDIDDAIFDPFPSYNEFCYWYLSMREYKEKIAQKEVSRTLLSQDMLDSYITVPEVKAVNILEQHNCLKHIENLDSEERELLRDVILASRNTPIIGYDIDENSEYHKYHKYYKKEVKNIVNIYKL